MPVVQRLRFGDLEVILIDRRVSRAFLGRGIAAKVSYPVVLMSFTRVPPAWRLPEGIDAPLWEYTHTSRLAAEEDAYFANHPLFQADERAVNERFIEPGRLVDLGCGTGRHGLRFAARGFSVTAVDLSRPMLLMVSAKAAERGVELTTVQSNLCRLGCFPDGSSTTPCRCSARWG